MALRISNRSWRSADSRARCCAHFTLEMATPARMPMIVTTTISSISVKTCCVRRRRGVNVEHVVRLADARRVGLVGVGEDSPIILAGHRIDQIALAQQAHDLAVAELDRLRQLLELLRPLALAHQRRFLDAVRRREHAQLVVAVDGLDDPAQPLAQLDLLLPPDAERQHGQRDRGEDADDGHDRDELRDGESSVFHSTFAWPPETVDATFSPRPFFSPGLSMTRYVSPVMPPRTRSAARSPPAAKRSGRPSDDVMRMLPPALSIVTMGGFIGSIFIAGPNETSATSIACGS